MQRDAFIGALLALWLLPFKALPQNADIYGTVIDSLSRGPIPYAVITRVGQGKAKAATSRGTYFLSNLQPGTHLLSVDISGYKTKSMRVFVVANQHLQETIELVPTLEPQDQRGLRTTAVNPSSIHGFVSDSVTGERIPYANVVLAGQNKGTAANAPGFYFLSNMRSRENTLAFSAVGYAKVSLTIFIDPATDLELDVTLSPAPVTMQEVVVTGTGSGRVGQLSTSLHVLSQQEIKLTPVTAQQDLFHSIQILPGIVSTSDVSSRFYVRGGAADQNLILLDGMTIYHPYHALGIFSIFDPDIVKSVEVFTSAFPAEFGERLSSVVNITTKDPRNDRIFARAHANLLSAKVQIEGPIGRGISFLANSRRSISKATFRKIVKDDVPISFSDLFVKGTMLSGGNERLDVAYLSTFDALDYDDPYSPDYRWTTHAISGSASYLIADRTFVQVATYYGSFESERRFDPALNAAPTSSKVLDFGLRANATAYLKSENTVFFGFQFGFPRFLYDFVNSGGVMLKRDETFPFFSTWFQYQGHAGEFLYSVGMNNDLTNIFYRRNTDGLFQPRVSLTYRLSDWWRMKASYGHYTQKVMTVNNEDDVIPTFEGWTLIPEKWPVESADHFVLAVDGNLYDNLSLSSEVYYKHYGSLLNYNREKFDAVDPDYIAGKEDAYGAEFLVRTKVAFTDVYASYTLSWAKINNGGVVYYPRYDRRHHVNVLGLLRPIENADIFLRWEYGSGFPFTQTIGFFDRLTMRNAIPGQFQFETGIPYTLLGSKNAGRLPPYHRLDLGGSYHFSFSPFKGSVSFSLINLYSSRNIFYYDRATGKRIDMIPFFPSVGLTLEM